MHPALRDANLTGDELRPLMLVGDQLYRVFAPDWHRLGKRLLTMTTTGQNPAPNTLPERRLITNGARWPNVTLRVYRSARGRSATGLTNGARIANRHAGLGLFARPYWLSPKGCIAGDSVSIICRVNSAVGERNER